MQGFAWKAAASRALPFLDLSAELFREANLRQCLQVCGPSQFGLRVFLS